MVSSRVVFALLVSVAAAMAATPTPAQVCDSLRITEIMHSPPRSLCAGGYINNRHELSEYIEFQNIGSQSFDLSRVTIHRDILLQTIPSGTIIAPGEIFLLIRRASAFKEVYGANSLDGIKYFLFTRKISNRDGIIQVHVKDLGGSNVCFAVHHFSTAPWPTEAAGNGHSIELVDIASKNVDASAWKASDCRGGSPGRISGPCFCPAPTTTTTTTTAAPTTTTTAAPTTAGTTAAGSTTKAATTTTTKAATTTTTSKVKACDRIKDIRITEIMHSPPTQKCLGDAHNYRNEFTEYFEIQNVGSSPVDMGNVVQAPDVRYTFEEGFVLAPGQIAVIVRSISDFTKRYGALDSSVLVREFSGAMHNRIHRLRLIIGTDVCLFVEHGPDAPYPEEAGYGNGHSMELINPSKFVSRPKPTDWKASDCRGGSPGTVGPAPCSCA